MVLEVARVLLLLRMVQSATTINTTNPTATVIYRLLGNIEPGQCTMILEEAEKIDQNYEIMAVLKTGYTRARKGR